MSAFDDNWREEKLALGRSIAARYERPFRVDGRTLTMVEADALLFFHANDPERLLDLALDRWSKQLAAWDGRTLS